ncbi:MAG: hypothetical protein JWP89_6369 [Schlesneria sp.]|nr:hypothetical protein [Schlesneria sp.]
MAARLLATSERIDVGDRTVYRFSPHGCGGQCAQLAPIRKFSMRVWDDTHRVHLNQT